ncbi:pilus assembly PilX family protein [Amphibiibacter pelophylacis]|uniref:Uncharacterized protein n=1 Tax=Amphibiibacter pelophylacis TaxID=1799477 RepID=A0ACC6NYM6_9BURK
MNTTTPFLRRSRTAPAPLRQSQRGVTLFFGMLFLLTIVLLTLGGVAMSRYQQRLALAMNDREVAFQSATLALRAAELRLQGKQADGSRDTAGASSGETQASSGEAPCGTTATPFPANGRCVYVAVPAANPYADEGVVWRNAPAATLQGFAALIPSGLRAPTYVVEEIPDQSVGDSSGKGGASVFRITAVGWGRFDSTLVRLQETYRPYSTGNLGQ